MIIVIMITITITPTVIDHKECVETELKDLLFRQLILDEELHLNVGPKHEFVGNHITHTFAALFHLNLVGLELEFRR